MKSMLWKTFSAALCLTVFLLFLTGCQTAASDNSVTVEENASETADGKATQATASLAETTQTTQTTRADVKTTIKSLATKPAVKTKTTEAATTTAASKKNSSKTTAPGLTKAQMYKEVVKSMSKLQQADSFFADVFLKMRYKSYYNTGNYGLPTVCYGVQEFTGMQLQSQNPTAMIAEQIEHKMDEQPARFALKDGISYYTYSNKQMKALSSNMFDRANITDDIMRLPAEKSVLDVWTGENGGYKLEIPADVFLQNYKDLADCVLRFIPLRTEAKDIKLLNTSAAVFEYRTDENGYPDKLSVEFDLHFSQPQEADSVAEVMIFFDISNYNEALDIYLPTNYEQILTVKDPIIPRVEY